MAKEGCHFCDKYKRDASVICVISSAKDAFSIEETHSYKGLYHVIGGLLSPLDGRHPDHLLLNPLIKRIETLHIKEMIIALDSTIEGDATALFLKQQLSAKNLQISRLAFGLPMGSSLDFVDGGTLTRALTGRQTF
jgi:recombination protein RecR